MWSPRARSWSDATWMGAAFCCAFALAVVVLAAFGVVESGVRTALAMTARFAFLLFWPAYTGGALAALFGARFLGLKRHARLFGLAFVSALAVHLGLVALLCSLGAPPGRFTFIFFGGAAVSAYLLALFSIPALHKALDPRYWRLLSIIGMNYVALAFITDFLNQPLGGGFKHVLAYLPFTTLSLAGPLLRAAAFVKAMLSGRVFRFSQQGASNR
jgi:hypothetical protein